MQAKTNDPAKRTQPYETSGGFGFYSVNRDYPYAEPRRPQSSLSAFGYTDYSAAFEDLHSLDGFDMGMDDSFRPRARDPFEDTDRMRRQLAPVDVSAPARDGGHAQFASVRSALALAEKSIDVIPSNLRVMNDMLGIGDIDENTHLIPEIDGVAPLAQPKRAKNKRAGRTAALGEKIASAVRTQVKNHVKTHARVNTRRLVAVASAVGAAIVAVIGFWIFGGFDPASRYVDASEVYVNGIAVGMVADKDNVQAAIDDIYKDLSAQYGVTVLDDQLLEVRQTRVDRRYLTSVEDVSAQIRRNLDAQVSASVIYVDGMAAVAFATEEDANWVLEQLKAPYADNATDIGFVQEVEIRQSDVSCSLLKNKTEALNFLQTGVDENDTYTVREGDTLDSIALAKNVTAADLVADNDGVSSDEDLSAGMTLNLVPQHSVIDVGSKQILTYNEGIAFATEYTTDASLYVGQSRVVQAGVNGEKEVTVEVRYIGSTEVERTVLSENVIRAATNQVVAQGTKRYGIIVQGVSSSGFMTPTNGTVTSNFGYRWGRLHAGIDIGAPTGTPIRAAKSGTVTAADWNGSYGKCVDISHGNGEMTRYGHCSQLLVSAGQTVSQGEVIALVGNTGRSTGSHLHFEVRINGTAYDPRNYLLQN